MILKRKLYANTPQEQGERQDPPEISKNQSTALQVERLKAQQRAMADQRAKERLRVEAKIAETRQQSKLKEVAQKEDEAIAKNQIKLKKVEAEKAQGGTPVSLVKPKAKPYQPVSMK